MPRISMRKKSKIKKSKGPSKEERTAVAYERLGIKPEEVYSVPQISMILKESGVDVKAVDYLRGSEEADAKKFVYIYDQLPASVRDLLPIEAFCVASGLSTKRVLELITGACFDLSDKTTELLVRTMHPKIVQSAITTAVALGKDGASDRKMLLQHTNFLPMPKTQVMNVKGNLDASQNIQNISVGQLMSIEDKMGRIADRFNERLGIVGEEQKLLPEAVDVQAESEEVEESNIVEVPADNLWELD